MAKSALIFLDVRQDLLSLAVFLWIVQGARAWPAATDRPLGAGDAPIAE